MLKLEESALEEPSATAKLLALLTLRAMVLDAMRRQVGLLAGKPPTKEQRRELREGKRAAEAEEQARKDDPQRPLPSLEKRVWMTLSLLVHYGSWSGWYQGSLGNYVLAAGLPKLLHDLAIGRFRWLLHAA